MDAIGQGTAPEDASGDAGTRRLRPSPRRWGRAAAARGPRGAAFGGGLSLVRQPDRGERRCAGPQRRRHRGADRRAVPHQRCARASGRRPRPAAADHRRQSGHPAGRDFAAGAGASALVHVLRRYRPFRQHHRQRGRDPALGQVARLQVGDRRHRELPYAARHGRARPRASGRDAGALSGGIRQDAGRAVVGKSGDRAAAVLGICEVYRRQGPHVAAMVASSETTSCCKRGSKRDHRPVHPVQHPVLSESGRAAVRGAAHAGAAAPRRAEDGRAVGPGQRVAAARRLRHPDGVARAWRICRRGR